MKQVERRFGFTVLCMLFAMLLATVHAYAQDSGRPGRSSANSDRTDISGTVKIAQVWSQQLRFPTNLSRGLINLVEATNRMTNIRVAMDRQVHIGTPEFEQLPFAYITTEESFELTPNEVESVKKFFDNGGFMVIETPTPTISQSSQAGTSLKKMVKDALGTSARFSPISKDHQLYHSFFDFDDGPPLGSEPTSVTNSNSYIPDPPANIPGVSKNMSYQPVGYLEGIWYEGRLIGLYSDKSYILNWNKSIGSGGDGGTSNPQLKMGVNFIMYALKNARGGNGSR